LFNYLWHYGLNINNLKENLNPKRFNNIVHKTIRNNGKQSKNPHPVTYQSDPKMTHESQLTSTAKPGYLHVTNIGATFKQKG